MLIIIWCTRSLNGNFGNVMCNHFLDIDYLGPIFVLICAVPCKCLIGKEKF